MEEKLRIALDEHSWDYPYDEPAVAPTADRPSASLLTEASSVFGILSILAFAAMLLFPEQIITTWNSRSEIPQTSLLQAGGLLLILIGVANRFAKD